MVKKSTMFSRGRRAARERIGWRRGLFLLFLAVFFTGMAQLRWMLSTTRKAASLDGQKEA